MKTRWIFVLTGVIALTVLITDLALGNLGVNFTQCANDNINGVPAGPCDFIGSNSQNTKAQWSDGMAVLQRILFDGIAATTGNVPVVSFQIQGSKNSSTSPAGSAHAYALTAVTLSSFEAKAGSELGSNSITLNWRTASEVNHAGFNVYRSDRADGPYVRINTQLIPAAFDPLTGGTYQYIDVNVVPGRTYYYQLEDVELNGTSTRHKPIAVTLDAQTGWSRSMLVFSGLGLGVVALACAGLIILRKRA